MNLEFKTYVRKPFVIEAVEITVENIEEIAPQVGTLHHKEEDGTPYIFVDPRIIPGVKRVYPGYMLTRKEDTIRCYSPKVFRAEFRDPENSPEMLKWVEYMDTEMVATGTIEEVAATS